MTTPGKGRIFISYRRADSAGYAGRIYDRLTAHFGKDAVFMDVDTIEAGLDFVEVLQNAVQSCDVLVALIGRSWLDIKDEAGKRRLDNPEDFVRVEITAALDRDIRVIPVLVDGVIMPRSTELPSNLKPLARRNALQVNHHSFNADARRLISQLELPLRAAEEKRKREAAEKVAREKEHREQMERAEKARKEKEVHEKTLAKEQSRLATVQWAVLEREDRKRKEVAEKAHKEKEERQLTSLTYKPRQESADRARSLIKPKPNWRPYGISGVVIALVCLIIGGMYLVQNWPVTTVVATPLPTKIPPANPSIGSTWVQIKDDMVLVYVPAGEFQMGSDAGTALEECRKFLNTFCTRDWFTNEEPIHAVRVDAFWIDQTEVTNAMYAKCVEGGACDPPSSTSSNIRDNYYGKFEFGDYPVIYISWQNAVSYCKWADRRLPTEAEWEKAAGWDEDDQVQRIYPWGDTFNGRAVNFCDTNCTLVFNNNKYNDGYADTAPVSSYSAGKSFYDAYNMAGNVWEWVADWYNYDYYNNSPDSNPNGPSTGEYRVLRGGSWNSSVDDLRVAVRNNLAPSINNQSIGFRCARDATP